VKGWFIGIPVMGIPVMGIPPMGNMPVWGVVEMYIDWPDIIGIGVGTNGVVVVEYMVVVYCGGGCTGTTCAV